MIDIRDMYMYSFFFKFTFCVKLIMIFVKADSLTKRTFKTTLVIAISFFKKLLSVCCVPLHFKVIRKIQSLVSFFIINNNSIYNQS